MSNGKKKKPKYHKIPEVQRTGRGERAKNAKIKKAARTTPTLAEKISTKASKMRDRSLKHLRNSNIEERDRKLDEELGKVPPYKRKKK